MTGLSERMSDSPTGANSASEGGDALAMLSIDARGRIVAASAAWLAKLGLERRDAIGRDWREFLAPPCRSDVERRVNEALARGGSFAGVPCAWVGESGRRVDALTFGFRDSRLAEEPGAWVMALVETRDRVAMALEASDLSIWEFDALDNRITHDGRSTEKLGLPSKPVYTRREILERMHRADRRGTLRTVAAALSGETARFSLLARLGGADGGWRWLRCDGKVAERDPDGRALRLIGTALDVTAEKATEASIYEMEYIDGLTRLPNRTLFMERLHAAIQEARINRLRFAVLFVDLDRFEEINDTQGHEVGEKALAEAARRLASRVRKAMFSPGSAATNSACSRSASMKAPPWRSRAGWSTASIATRSPWAASRSRSASASASPCTPKTVRGPTCCCATPTSRCSAPRRAGSAPPATTAR